MNSSASFRRVLPTLLTAICIGFASLAQAVEVSKWQLAGGASLDAKARTGESANASIKVPAGAQASVKLREADGAGKVEFWILDDGTAPADPKKRRTGPRWGLTSSDGRVIVVGALYAPYVSGDTSYCAADYNPTRQETPFQGLQYLGVKRTQKWQKWTFDFDAGKGLQILVDGKDVNTPRTQRFDWNKTKIAGFSGVTVLGDESGDGAATVWITEPTIQLAGEMSAVPTPPPPPPPAVPETDPVLDGPPVQLRAEAMKGHPRVLFGAQELEKMRAFYQSDKAAAYRASIEKMLPVCEAPTSASFLTDATDGQRQGFWRLPTVALHYALTGDKQSFDRAFGYLKFLNAQKNWEGPKELDSGMSAGNIMIGAGLAFDLLHGQLPEDFRETFRKKLWYHARAMYHGGHLMKVPGVHYWQNDPQNNHRWHRDAGMILCALAAYTGAPDEHWLMQKIYDEMKHINEWLPEDGTCHESATYLIFGTSHLTLANMAADRCFGTNYLKAPFFQHVTNFMLQSLTPGFDSVFQFGDSGDKPGFYGHFAYKAVSDHKQSDLFAGLQQLAKVDPKVFSYHWMTMLWLDPELKEGDASKLPTTSLFPDLGLAFLRDGWASNNVGAMFKCGPLGGYKLNEFRERMRDEKGLRYINVAHDDPDANSFILWSNGAFVAETDRYSQHKRSANHNTILINGMGQMVPGRAEDQVFSQPASGNFDMREQAVLTAWKDAGDVVVIEGEAAGSYLQYTDKKTKATRPALDRYRRQFIWVRGSYVLLIDDIRSPQPVNISWLIQAPELTQKSANELAFDLKHAKASCGMLTRSINGIELTPTIGESPADNKSKILGWKQLQLNANTESLQMATLLTPWGGDVKYAIEGNGSNGPVKIIVTGNGFKDEWKWIPAIERFEPATLEGSRQGGFTVKVDGTSKPPKP